MSLPGPQVLQLCLMRPVQRRVQLRHPILSQLPQRLARIPSLQAHLPARPRENR